MSSWLVAGVGGMLGRDMASVLEESGETVAALGRSTLDVRDPEACQQAVRGHDVVVNAAAWTDVDGAEQHEAQAFEVNALGAANLARACRDHGAILVHVSTDYVFAGDRDSPYPVDAPVRPLSAYGRTKAAGEWAVLAHCPQSYVVRTAWLYGAHGRCFPRTMLRLARERDVVEVVDDQRGQPTWTVELARFLRTLVVTRQAFGIHHGTASGETTWFGFAREIFARCGLDPERVRPVTSDRFVRPAARPAYSVLDNADALPQWADSLASALPGLSAG